jgi:hypothetical protein
LMVPLTAIGPFIRVKPVGVVMVKLPEARLTAAHANTTSPARMPLDELTVSEETVLHDAFPCAAPTIVIPARADVANNSSARTIGTSRFTGRTPCR